MYKIIHEGNVIDVVRNPTFIRFLSSGHIAVTGKMSAHGIVGSDKTVYSFKPIQDKKTLVVSIEKINLEEFNRLASLLNSSPKVSEEEKELLTTKNTAINRLSNICSNKITSGFSIRLLDGNTYKFNLTVEDQLNLLSLENQLNAGENIFIYHAAGLPCRVFVREDILKIIKAYRKHVLYHTTYFNVAKQYINSLTDVNKINSFYYGTDVAGTTKDPTLRQILLGGGIN